MRGTRGGSVYFEQFYLSCLSHASYMVASGGVAAVVDPQRDVGIYLREARRHGLRIGYVIETHLHADFVSGHRELAEITGASIYLGARAGAKFLHVPVREGDTIRFGNCRLDFLETPGHTLESVTVLVTDLERSERPFAALTGDTLFIGDVGRPDLSPDHTPQQLAHMLYGSLQKLLNLPDEVEVWPAHGAGSLCGRNLSKERRSTIGQERVANYALRAGGRDAFVRLLTAELPERPGYFALDAEINRQGAAPLTALPPLCAMTPEQVLARQREGATVLDTRPAPQFEGAHVPGALHIGLTGQYAAWAGTLLGLDAEIVLVAEDPAGVEEARLRLARVGIERVPGYLRDGLLSWDAAGLPLEEVERIGVDELECRRGELQVIDVRRPAEWDEGHIEGALLRPLDRLRETGGAIDRSRPAAVLCQSGYRSAIAASILQAEGMRGVIDVAGGFEAWKTRGLPYVKGSGAASR
jgi:hydroxyacylglutathione hydrolase